jgi:hypothetical protein
VRQAGIPCTAGISDRMTGLRGQFVGRGAHGAAGHPPGMVAHQQPPPLCAAWCTAGLARQQRAEIASAGSGAGVLT